MNKEIRLRQYSTIKYVGIPLGLGFIFDENGQRLINVGVNGEEKYLPELIAFDIDVKYKLDDEDIIVEEVEGKCLDDENKQYYNQPETYTIQYMNDLILEDDYLKDQMIKRGKKTN